MKFGRGMWANPCLVPCVGVSDGPGSELKLRETDSQSGQDAGEPEEVLHCQGIS